MLLTHTDKGAPYKVAVYGTLKNGFGNHPIIRNYEDSRYLGTGQCNGILLDRGAFPGAILYKDLSAVHGAKAFATDLWVRCEVYEVNEKCLDRLDLLEGHPNHYNRQLIRLTRGTFDGDAWVYTLPVSYICGVKNIARGGEWFGGNTTFTKVDFSDGTIKPRIISVGSSTIYAPPNHSWTPRTSTHNWEDEGFDPISNLADEEELDPEPDTYFASIAKKVKNA